MKKITEDQLRSALEAYRRKVEYERSTLGKLFSARPRDHALGLGRQELKRIAEGAVKAFGNFNNDYLDRDGTRHTTTLAAYFDGPDAMTVEFKLQTKEKPNQISVHSELMELRDGYGLSTVYRTEDGAREKFRNLFSRLDQFKENKVFRDMAAGRQLTDKRNVLGDVRQIAAILGDNEREWAATSHVTTKRDTSKDLPLIMDYLAAQQNLHAIEVSPARGAAIIDKYDELKSSVENTDILKYLERGSRQEKMDLEALYGLSIREERENRMVVGGMPNLDKLQDRIDFRFVMNALKTGYGSEESNIKDFIRTKRHGIGERDPFGFFEAAKSTVHFQFKREIEQEELRRAEGQIPRIPDLLLNVVGSRDIKLRNDLEQVRERVQDFHKANADRDRGSQEYWRDLRLFVSEGIAKDGLFSDRVGRVDAEVAERLDAMAGVPEPMRSESHWQNAMQMTSAKIVRQLAEEDRTNIVKSYDELLHEMGPKAATLYVSAKYFAEQGKESMLGVLAKYGLTPDDKTKDLKQACIDAARMIGDKDYISIATSKQCDVAIRYNDKKLADQYKREDRSIESQWKIERKQERPDKEWAMLTAVDRETGEVRTNFVNQDGELLIKDNDPSKWFTDVEQRDGVTMAQTSGNMVMVFDTEKLDKYANLEKDEVDLYKGTISQMSETKKDEMVNFYKSETETIKETLTMEETTQVTMGL